MLDFLLHYSWLLLEICLIRNDILDFLVGTFGRCNSPLELVIFLEDVGRSTGSRWPRWFLGNFSSIGSFQHLSWKGWFFLERFPCFILQRNRFSFRILLRLQNMGQIRQLNWPLVMLFSVQLVCFFFFQRFRCIIPHGFRCGVVWSNFWVRSWRGIALWRRTHQ
jgi:hypothetical protein